MSSLSRDLSGRVAVVTGAASGIGRATALLFADLGAHVALVDLSLEGLRPLEAEAQAKGVRARAFQADLAQAAETKRLAGEVLQHFGEVDILVNNAGVGSRALPITEGSDEAFEKDWARNFAVNVMAQARLVRFLAASLGRDGCGRVVNIASTEGSGATFLNTAYVAAKHASVGLTKGLAVELASRGVCVNCVQPGPIRTGMTQAVPERAKEYYAKRLVPMRRYGLPEEVAHVVVSLCLPAFRWVNGACVPADGGLLANNALLPMKLPWKEKSLLPEGSSKL